MDGLGLTHMGLLGLLLEGNFSFSPNQTIYCEEFCESFYLKIIIVYRILYRIVYCTTPRVVIVCIDYWYVLLCKRVVLIYFNSIIDDFDTSYEFSNIIIFFFHN